jgi:type II secretory pathway pseudopilin PulG
MLTGKNHKSGFTLLEAVIYVAVLGFLVIILINTLVATGRSFVNFQIVNRLDESAALTLDRLVREVRAASSVNVAQSSFNTNPGRLMLNTIGGSTTEFYTQNGVMMIKQGATAAATSTDPSLAVTNLIFRYLTTSRSQAVRVELTLAQTTGAVTRSEKFYTTAVLRGSY